MKFVCFNFFSKNCKQFQKVKSTVFRKTTFLCKVLLLLVVYLVVFIISLIYLYECERNVSYLFILVCNFL